LFVNERTTNARFMDKAVKTSSTDLRIGQIGHGLGLRGFGGPAQLFPMTTQC